MATILNPDKLLIPASVVAAIVCGAWYVQSVLTTLRDDTARYTAEVRHEMENMNRTMSDMQTMLKAAANDHVTTTDMILWQTQLESANRGKDVVIPPFQKTSSGITIQID